ncbi:MAG: ThuA domain-containing protein [Actinobacteria bacterium]|nr:ThuA domain-containing protein [Actinomycetota bacterium]
MRNLLLSGGPGHDFDLTSAELIRILDAGCVAQTPLLESGSAESPGVHASAKVSTHLVEQPAAFFELLRLSLAGEIEPWDLITVNALRWKMQVDRYAELRNEWAYSLQHEDIELMREFVTQGGGLLALHTAVICFDAHPIWKQLTGASWNWSASSHPPVGEFEVSITAAGSQHPVTAQAQNFLLADELYGFLDQVPDLIPLLTAPYLGVEQPLLWAQSIGSGRVVTDLLGHSVESLSNATHQDVLTRAAFWAARDPQRVDAEQVRSA